MLTRTCCVLSALLCLTATLSAAAVEDAKPTVSGSGLVVVRPTPDRLRLVMQVKAHGTTTQSALDNLKTQRDAIVAKLKKLDADADSICFDTPLVGNLADEPSIAVGAVPPTMPVEAWTPGPTTYTPVPAPAYSPYAAPPTLVQAAPGTATPEKKAPPTMYIARTVLRVEWLLPKDGPDQLAVAVAEIKEKVKAADLDKIEAKKNISAAEEELIEEAEMGLNSGRIVTQAYSPFRTQQTFVYVAKPTDAQRKQALAEAFKRAKHDAAELAEAAGMSLGPISSISSHGNFAFNYPSMSYGDNKSFSPLLKLEETEIVADNPNELEFTLMMNVNFQLSPSGK